MLFNSVPKYITMAYYIKFLWIPQNVTLGNAKCSKVMGHFSYMYSMPSIDLIDVITSKTLSAISS